MSEGISYHKAILNNSLRVVGECHPYGNAISLGLAIDFGSRDEGPGEQGAAHLLEHLCFKATEKYTAFELVDAWESRGGDLNAFTAKEFTCFHAFGLKEDLALAMDLLQQIVFFNRWTAEDLAAEKSVIAQEILMSYDTPDDFMFDDFTQRFLMGSSMAHPIFGSLESVSQMQEANLRALQDHYYRPERAVLVVTGNFVWTEFLSLAERCFASLVSEPLKKREFADPQSRSFLHFEQRQSHHKHFLLGFNGHSLREGRHIEASVLSNYLSGGMNSLLFQKIREQQSLCYQISASYGPNEQVGIFSCYSSTQEDKLVALTREVYEVFLQIAAEGISAEAIAASAEQLRCSLLLGEDDIDSRMQSLVFDEIFARPYSSVQDWIEQLKMVNESTMTAYIQKYFRLSTASVYYFGQLSSSTRKSLQTAYQEFIDRAAKLMLS